MVDGLEAVHEFLYCKTPDAWVSQAIDEQHILLIDHANCEKKAAATALNLTFKYVDRPKLLHRMSRLAREELRHFEQVLRMMQKRQIPYEYISASRYAHQLRQACRRQEPGRLIDTLIVGAYIEARSCERFAKIAPFLDEELQRFYISLLKSEARHFQHYLELAEEYSQEPIEARVAEIGDLEASLICSEDDEFRFHSGIPKS